MDGRTMQTQVLEEQPTAVCQATLQVAEIGPWLARTYHTIAEVLAAHGAQIAGPPFALYQRHPEHADDRFTVEAGFPVTAAIGDLGLVRDGGNAGDVRASSLPGGPVATTVHVGPYDQMEGTYDALVAWAREQGGRIAGPAWEIYLSDPAAEPDPSTWRTRIVQPYDPT